MSTLLDDFSTIDEFSQGWKQAALRKRGLAYFIDNIIISLVIGPIQVFISSSTGTTLSVLLYYVGYVLYGAYFEAGEKRATLGKRLLNIQTISLEQGQLTMNEALKRNVLKVILCIIPFIMFITLMISDDRRGLHDKSANSWVVDVQ